MVASALRILINHDNPVVNRRLRQALLAEPDIQLLDLDLSPDDAFEQRVRDPQPDIVLTNSVEEDGQRGRLLDLLRDTSAPPRIVLVNGHAAPGASLQPPPAVPVDQYLLETASQTEILRTIRLVQTPSTYLRYLPAIYSQDEFMGRFLRIFESVVDPVDQQIDGLEHYFDPDLAPARFLPWLASWLEVAIDDRWPRERQVALIRAAPELHRWRGTRRGLREHLRLYLGVEPEIEEAAGGLRLGPSTQLGFRTTLGDSGPRHHFTLTLRVSDPATLDYTAVCALIEAQKPAHCTYSLVILPAAAASATVSEPSGPADENGRRGSPGQSMPPDTTATEDV
jgi:phage tail-like protein